METKNVTKPTIKEIKEGVLKLLSTNTEWEKRYAGYITMIDEVRSNSNPNYRSFRMPNQLSRYCSVSLRDRNTYDLRYAGKSIGKVVCNNDGIGFRPNATNIKGYGYPNEVDSELDWNDRETSRIRSYFKNHAKNHPNVKQPEHRLENRMLRYFKSDEKIFEIRPVELYSCFFQMPTPLKASDHTIIPTYAKFSGGGIDILARFTPQNRKKGEYSRLCVMELKDKNEDRESQADAMGQAVAYAVFIAKLLRSRSGQKWWDFFMNRETNDELTERSQKLRNVSNVHDIEVVTIMPDGNTEEFKNEDILIEETGITLHCHTLYYNDKSYDNGKGEIKFVEDKSTFIQEVRN